MISSMQQPRDGAYVAPRASMDRLVSALAESASARTIVHDSLRAGIEHCAAEARIRGQPAERMLVAIKECIAAHATGIPLEQRNELLATSSWWAISRYYRDD